MGIYSLQFFKNTLRNVILPHRQMTLFKTCPDSAESYCNSSGLFVCILAKLTSSDKSSGSSFKFWITQRSGLDVCPSLLFIDLTTCCSNCPLGLTSFMRVVASVCRTAPSSVPATVAHHHLVTKKCHLGLNGK